MLKFFSSVRTGEEPHAKKMIGERDTQFLARSLTD
jgi:hypothetical protein